VEQAASYLDEGIKAQSPNEENRRILCFILSVSQCAKMSEMEEWGQRVGANLIQPSLSVIITLKFARSK